MKPTLLRLRFVLALGLTVLVVLVGTTQAEDLSVIGGPRDELGFLPSAGFGTNSVLVNNSGTAVGTVAHSISGLAARWDASGAPPVLLDSLVNADGQTLSVVWAINDAGVVAGGSLVFSADSVLLGVRPVRWAGPGTAVTELGHLGGTNAVGFTNSSTLAMNAAGTAVGYAHKYDASQNYIGQRAVRWDASSTTPVELPNPVGFGNGETTFANDVNDEGVIVGFAGKAGEDAPNSYPVRWEASGEVTLLDSFETGPGQPGLPWVISNDGTAIGWGQKFDLSGKYLGDRALRWEAGGTAVTELDGLGYTAEGSAWAKPAAINDAGEIVGWADKFDALGRSLGKRAVRWNAGSAVPTELDNLGHGLCIALDINSAGVAVGAMSLPTDLAVFWLRDGTAVDLNTLIDPDSGWVLRYASDISDTGWIAGYGSFDPDGPGGQDPYGRMFSIRVPAAAVTYAGDYNNDGIVDAADYVVWRDTLGQTGPHLAADSNGNSIIDAGDFDVWRANFGAAAAGQTAATSETSLPVPEPSTSSLGAAFFSLLVVASRRCGMAASPLQKTAAIQP